MNLLSDAASRRSNEAKMSALKAMKSISIVAAILAGAAIASSQETVLFNLDELSELTVGQQGGVIVGPNGHLFGTVNSTQTTGGGVVFELAIGVDGLWHERILRSGFDPLGGLAMDAKGNIYGTTVFGGSGCGGTVFELEAQPNDTYIGKTVHNFGPGGKDGCFPYAGVAIDKNGNLYGTTYNSGTDQKGTVYEISPTADGGWTEKVLWSFAGSPDDGGQPWAGVTIDPKGNLFGTTYTGGLGLGTVFELMPQSDGSWTEKIICSFASVGVYGSQPTAGLVLDKSGNLYGTTPFNGPPNGPYGTVFELSPQPDGTWKQTILHGFGLESTDGSLPAGTVIFDPEGNLYGMTEYGGEYNSGTIFRLSPLENGKWSETILYSFNPAQGDGTHPMSGLSRDSAGNFYGTTTQGGTLGGGVVFELSNPDRLGTPQFSIAAGTYTSLQTVKISEYTSGAKIYYTTNGDEPTTSSTKYTGPIKVDQTETIKAIAVTEGLSDSEIASAEYSIDLPAAAPKFSLASGTYHAVQTLTITDATPHVTIYFTLNGTTPTTASRRYTEPISISSTETISAMAAASDHPASSVTRVTYTIKFPPAATPLISPRSGSYASGQKIAITDATPEAAIYYTTNGATPTTSSPRYTSAGIVLRKSETVQAIAIAKYHTQSAVASAAYTAQ